MELSKNDANLLTTEGVFIFISKKLGKIDFEIGNEMLVASRRRAVNQNGGATKICVAHKVFTEFLLL
jgi:hypothetical protein